MAEKKIQKYDFRRPDRISKNQIRSLHSLHERFARNVSSSISAYLRTGIEVTLETIAQISYSDFLNAVSDPTCYAAVSLKPLDGMAAIEISPSLVFPIIDRLLGGTGESVAPFRPMTEIEQSIMQNVLRLMMDNLKESWRPVYAVEFSLNSIETDPQMAQITSPNEMVIHFQFQARMRETIAKLHLAIPTLVLDSIIHVFDQEEHSRRKIVQDGTILHLLPRVPLNVTIETTEASFALETLLSLQVGDTLVLDQREQWPIVLKVNGKHKMYARAQTDTTRKTFQITAQIRAREEESVNGTTNQSD